MAYETKKGLVAVALINTKHATALIKSDKDSIYFINHDHITEIKNNLESVDTILEGIGFQNLFIAGIITLENNPIDISTLGKNFLYSAKHFNSEEIKSRKDRLNFLSRALHLAVHSNSLTLIKEILKNQTDKHIIMDYEDYPSGNSFFSIILGF